MMNSNLQSDSFHGRCKEESGKRVDGAVHSSPCTKSKSMAFISDWFIKRLARSPVWNSRYLEQDFTCHTRNEENIGYTLKSKGRVYTELISQLEPLEISSRE